MAKIPLRNYLREIDELIERELYDEAIAHCRHILEDFPKHIDTYRALGKTFLEAKRYSDAADILQRVLSSLPADFIANLGMSIIREDEGNLDDAIWHMERAFEIQPSNSTIQAEMRRLYGRRDGIEPPKVRLTRGALARMYVKGGLTPQAVAEIRAALAEDPDRADLQVLLANVYYNAGQRVEAAEVCSALLKKLPYCYDANRILSEILEETDRAQEARAYRERVHALDPYAAYVSPAAPAPEQVQAISVLVEKLDYRPENKEAAGPEWAASLGVAVASEKPDEEEIPDWMREAGWGPASGEAVERPLDLPVDKEPAGPAPTGELEATDLPDWLRDMDPETPGWESGEESGNLETPDFLAGPLEGDEETTAAAGDLPEWMKEFESEAGAEPEASGEEGPAQSYDLPDWMDSAESAALPDAEADLPDWLKELDPGTPETLFTPERTGQADEPLVWEPDEGPAETGGPADWQPENAWDADEAPAGAAQEDSTSPFTPEEEDAAFAWLEGQASSGAQEADTGAGDQTPDAESFAVENRPADGEPEDELPDWLLESEAETAFGAAVFSIPQPPTGEPDEANLPAFLHIDEGPVIEGDTQPTRPHAAVEQAAETGAEPEIEARASQQPWAPEQPEMPGEGQDEAAQPAFTEGDHEPETPAEVSSTVSETEEGLPTSPAEGEEPPAAEDEYPALSPDAEAEAFAWLESLAARQGAEEALLLQPEERLETPPDWIQEAIQAAENEAGADTESEAFAPADASGAALLGFSQPSAPQAPEQPAAEETPVEEAPAEAPLSEPEVVQGRMEEQAWQEEAGVETEADRPEPGEELGGGDETAARTAEMPAPVESVETGPVEPAAEPPAEAPVTSEELEQGIQEERAWQAGTESPEPGEEPGGSAALEETGAAEAALEPPEGAGEQLPELPTWLAGLDEEAGAQEEAVPWTPPEESRPRPLTDLNHAALNELERLPGIGFIRAQTIIQHRERHGDFASVDDLLQVPGFDPDTLAGVRSYLFVEPPKPAAGALVAQEAGEAPADAPAIENIAPEQVRLIQARNALAQGRRDESLAHYDALIREERLLHEVIQDLHEALYRFPVDVEIWQALGDAHLRAGQLKEALEAYTKAEELLR